MDAGNQQGVGHDIPRARTHGVVVVEGPEPLPEGAEVAVDVLSSHSNRLPPELESRLEAGEPAAPWGIMKYAGKAVGLPADASHNLDYYLYGNAQE